MLILIVDDDDDYAEIIAHALKREGHETVQVGTVRDAVRFADRKSPDLAVLDLVLPDGNGLDLCASLRERIPELPVLLLSSLDRSADVVAGLNAGGDDYLVKPFHPGELCARTRALLRRANSGSVSWHAPAEVMTVEGLEVDVTNHHARFNGTALNCTPIEVDILGQMARYPGQALSHAFLTEKVWGYTNIVDATLLKGHVSSIRRKIREVGGDEEMIRTVHGVGYSFTPV